MSAKTPMQDLPRHGWRPWRIGFLGGLEGERHRDRTKEEIEKTFRRLLFIMEGGFRYAHDPIGGANLRRIRKGSGLWDSWHPQPVFMRKFVISWDLDEESLDSDDIVPLNDFRKKHPKTGCVRSHTYHIISEDGLLGEIMRESTSRFRPSESEDRIVEPSDGHKKTCFVCLNSPNHDSQRYIRGLPDKSDARWV